jgi:Flp pilus assembly protein TadD
MDEAASLLESALREIGPDERLHALLGEVYLALGRADEAIGQFQAAAALDPNSAELLNSLCVACVTAGRFEDALYAGERAVHLAPDFPEAHLNLGAAYLHAGRADKAVESLQLYASLSPTNSHVFELLGVSYRALGNLSAARDAFLRCVELEPQSATAHYEFGVSCGALKDWEQAEPHLRLALELEPGREEFLVALGDAQINLRRWEEAAETLRNAAHSAESLEERESRRLHFGLYKMPLAKPITPEDLAGWLLMEIKDHPTSPYALWEYGGDSELDDPIYGQTLGRIGREFPKHPWLETNLRVLEEFPRRADFVPPGGFIFHVSRCGSTALSNALRAARGCISIAEPEPMLTLLWPSAEQRWPYAGAEWEVEVRKLLLGCLAAFGQRRRGDERRLFVKFSNWNVVAMDLLKELWPDVPCVFMYRDPLEVVASNVEKLPPWYTTPLPPEFFGLNAAETAAMSAEEYISRVVGLTCKAAAQSFDARTLLLNYQDFNADGMRQVFRFFGIADSEIDESRLRASLKIYAKDAEAKTTFVPDGDAKRHSASPLVHEMVLKYAAEPYAELERLRAYRA